MGMPRFMTRLFSFLLQENHSEFIKKRAAQLYDEETFKRLLPDENIKQEIQYNDDEIFEVRNLQNFLDGAINFNLYEALFRMLSMNKFVESNWNLRANVKSINNGLK